MSSWPGDFRVEINPWPAGQAAGNLQPVDVTDRVTLEDLGSVNRAVERDFLSFRTGDLTFGLINDDGGMDDLFFNLGATDRWHVRFFRRGRVFFLGILLGQGSITFDRLEKMVEITAYGPTKVLDETSAESVTRVFGALTVTTATAGQSTLTINDTTGLLTGDVLHLTDQVNKEDVTVKQVTSATDVALEAPLVKGYASGSPVTNTTPFHRYKTVDFLARALFAAAAVPVVEIALSRSQFKRAVPTPVNISGLPSLGTNNFQRGGPSGIGGKTIVTISGLGTYQQASPSDAWTQYDANDRPWVDWSRYYTEDEAAPTIFLRSPGSSSDVTTDEFGRMRTAVQICGWDYKSATKAIFFLWVDSSVPSRTMYLATQTSADGTTWGAQIDLVTLVLSPDGHIADPHGCEYDTGRALVYCSWYDSSVPANKFSAWDGAILTSLKLGGDTNNVGYWGAVYVPSKDYVLVLRGTGYGTSPAGSTGLPKSGWEVLAFRGKTLLWRRPFPNFSPGNGISSSEPFTFPTQTLREVNGVFYCMVVNDGDLRLLVTDDEFQSYSLGSVESDTSITRYGGARIANNYFSTGHRADIPRSFDVYAPFYAGVVSYADYKGKSAAEALKDLAVLTNATFWVDDDFQGHFIARDLVPGGEIVDLTERDLLSGLSEIKVWEEVRQYVEVSGGGFTARAGDPNFSADGLSISSALIPNEAYGQALADQYAEFYSKRRALLEGTVIDEEGLEIFPMRRVIIDGRRFYVHESDQDAPNDEWPTKFLEDLENQPAA